MNINLTARRSDVWFLRYSVLKFWREIQNIENSDFISRFNRPIAGIKKGTNRFVIGQLFTEIQRVKVSRGVTFGSCCS
jgi:hypothetical protein